MGVRSYRFTRMLIDPRRSQKVLVEIEIGVLVRQCLDRCIADQNRLAREAAAWERRRNDDGATIRWMVNGEKARDKLARHCPDVTEQGPCPIVRAA